MIAWKRAALLGLASWAIPFALSFLAFPLKKLNAPLFETLMALVELITAGALFQRYFRGRTISAGEGVSVGPALARREPHPGLPDVRLRSDEDAGMAYYSEIGLVYLTFPAFGFWATRLAHR